VLNDNLARARALEPLRIGERDYRVFEIERSYFVDSPLVLQLPPALLRFAFATRFDDGFLDGRIAADRIEAYVLSLPQTLQIHALPEQGRPSDFSGAVGTLRLRSEIDRRELDLGSSLKFSLFIEGEGNLERFEAPRLDALDGWRVLGLIDVRAPKLRSIEYDLAPRAVEVQRVPPIEFSYFDTSAPASYRTLHSEAHEVRVRANTATKPAPPSASTTQPVEQPAKTQWMWWVAGAIGRLFAALAVRARLGSKRGRPETKSRAVDSARVQSALAAVRARAEASDAEQLQVFAEYLAARLDVATSSVFDPGLEARLIAAGVPRELAQRSQTWIDSLVAARYGGKPLDSGPARAGGLLQELEAAFAART
jgi:hypothetical protein